MTKDQKQQFTLRITQANATEMIVILYEMLLEYLSEAGAALKDEEEEAFGDAVRKARGCLNELLNSLNLEYEPAPSLRKLYFFCIRRLATAQARHSEEALSDIVRVIEPLRRAYAEIAPQDKREPVMGNSQEVYAGLTYGRDALTENMADQGSNRGMRV